MAEAWGMSGDIFPDGRMRHFTLSGRLPFILEKGLLPDAPKLFARGRTATPSFGGIYYTRRITDAINIFNNMSGMGVFARNDLVILSFDGDFGRRVDEDDFISVSSEGGRGSERVEWIGRDMEEPPGLLDAYRRFLAGGQKAGDYSALAELMGRFFDRAALLFPDPDKGNVVERVPPESIRIESVLHPMLGRDDRVVWRHVRGCAPEWAEAMDAMKIDPGMIDHYWPWDCCLDLADGPEPVRASRTRPSLR